jgi:RNA polymerase sigma-70 factor (ECF subfamily)
MNTMNRCCPPNNKICGTSEHQLGELVAQRRGWLLAQARNMCRYEMDAEDLVQEVFLRFIQSFAQQEALPSERSCEAWLATTLTRLFYDQCRRRTVRERKMKDLRWSGEDMVVQKDDSLPVYDSLTDEQWSQAFQALSPKLRATLELYAAGRRYEDIARTLEIGIGTVAKRMFDARTKLRELLLPPPPEGLN